MADGLGLDAWWDEPEYKRGNTLRLLAFMGASPEEITDVRLRMGRVRR